MTILASGTTLQAASGFIGRYTATAWMLPQIGPRFGYCTVYDRTYPVAGVDPASPEAELNAGTALPLSGPGLLPGFAAQRSVAANADLLDPDWIQLASAGAAGYEESDLNSEFS